MLLPPGRRRRWRFDGKIIAAFWIGTTSGAMLSAITVWSLGGILEPLNATSRTTLLLSATAFIWLSRQGSLPKVCSLPEARRQIPAHVFGGNPVRGAIRFGAELGTGMRTYVSSPAPYVLVMALFLVGSTLAEALLVAVGFGLGRSLPLVVQFCSGSRERVPAVVHYLGHSAGAFAAAMLVAIGALRLV